MEFRENVEKDERIEKKLRGKRKGKVEMIEIELEKMKVKKIEERRIVIERKLREGIEKIGGVLDVKKMKLIIGREVEKEKKKKRCFEKIWKKGNKIRLKKIERIIRKIEREKLKGLVRNLNRLKWGLKLIRSIGKDDNWGGREKKIEERIVIEKENKRFVKRKGKSYW